jgi:nucleotide-binding universal stress UspA family protein
MFQHILVPLDGSLRAERALPVAARLARASEGMLILMRTVKTAPEDGQATCAGSPIFQAVLQAEQEEAQHYLTAIASSHMLAGLPIILSAPQGPVVVSIQTIIQTYQADVLVCCAQPELGGFHHLLDPFVERLSQRLAIPLLLLPAQESLHHSLAEPGEPMSCLIAFPGSQPEPALIQPAASLLAALAGQEPGHLHCVPLRSVLSRSAMMHSELPVATSSPKQSRFSGRSAVLLKEAQVETRHVEKQEQQSYEVIVLGLPLPDIERDALREVATYPRLLVPSPVREA